MLLGCGPPARPKREALAGDRPINSKLRKRKDFSSAALEIGKAVFPFVSVSPPFGPLV